MASIVFDSISKSFKVGFSRTNVLHSLSLEVGKGEIFGFLGPNGAGKSTSIKILLNFIRPDSGRIHVNGHQVHKSPFQRHIGYLPELPCFYENLTGIELLNFGGNVHGLDKTQIANRSVQVLDRLNLKHAGAQRIKTYSKGMKQRLGLAFALMHDPDIYILDEPMSGLDPMGRHLITEVILELKEQGKTVFFSSHILSDIERLCDRIGILNKGRLLYCGGVAEFTSGNGSLEDAFIRLITEDGGR